jgi:hypothetical protein
MMQAKSCTRFGRVSQSHLFLKPLLGATDERVGRYSVHIDNHCDYCGDIETDQHLFLNAIYQLKSGLQQLTLHSLLITFMQKKMVFKCPYLFFLPTI